MSNNVSHFYHPSIKETSGPQSSLYCRRDRGSRASNTMIDDSKQDILAIPTTQPTIPSLIQSMYNKIIQENQSGSSFYHPMKLLLQGPPKSGRTSLLMNYALSIASCTTQILPSSVSSSCPYCGLKYNIYESNEVTTESTSDINSTSPNNNELSVCHCCAVAILIPYEKKSLQNFPLSCSPKECNPPDSTIINNENSVPDSTKYNDNQNHNLNSENQNREYFNILKMNALRRIKIKYVKSISDIIRFLSSIHSMNDSIKPWGSVIIDDLDWYLNGHNPNSTKSSSNTNESIQLMQLVALISETCDCLNNTKTMDHNRSTSFILSLSSDTVSSLPKHILQMIQTYIPTVATIENLSNDFTKTSAKIPQQKYLMNFKTNVSCPEFTITMDHDNCREQISLAFYNSREDDLMYSLQAHSSYNISRIMKRDDKNQIVDDDEIQTHHIRYRL